MGEYTRYPEQVDTSNELPKVTDLVTPVKGEVPNRQRDAILAIENELGAQPSGTFSTVASRLDAYDGALNGLGARVTEIEENGGGGGGGGTGEGVIASKARRYLSTSNFLGGAVTVPQVVVWNATSTRVAAARTSVAATTISPTISGHYHINCQLTLTPTIDSVGGVLIEVLSNGISIHSLSDKGGVWQVSIEKSFCFSLTTDLLANDTVSIRWTHQGSSLSRTTLVAGENKSWFSISRICGVE